MLSDLRAQALGWLLAAGLLAAVVLFAAEDTARGLLGWEHPGE